MSQSHNTVSAIEKMQGTEAGIFYLEHGWPSDLIRWHAHAPYELHLMIETHGKVFIGDYVGRYEPGTLILTGPNLPHNWVTNNSISETVDVREMVVLFTHQSISKLIEAFPEFTDILSTLDLSSYGILFEDFPLEKSKHLFARVRDSKGMQRVIAFLELLKEAHAWQKKTTLSVKKINTARTVALESKVNTVVKYITENFNEELSLKQAADLVNMSESAFSRQFQRATQNKFVEFVNRVRISEACTKLAQTNQPVSTICFSVGFNNISNFNRQFIKLKGKTPVEYRKIFHTNLGKGKPLLNPEIMVP